MRDGGRGEALTSFDIARGVNDASSGTARPDIDANVVVNVRVEVVVRTGHG